MLPANGMVLMRAAFQSGNVDKPGSETIAVTLPSRTVETLPDEPVKSGLVFAGWNMEPNGDGEQFTADTRVSENITVYAAWATPGLQFTLINDGKEYSVQKGTADTTGTVVIPGYWSGKKVTAVSAYGFSQCDAMTSVAIPDHVTSIGADAFHGCSSLTSVTLPGNLAYIGKGAFYSCTGLAGIAIPDSVTEIGSFAFAYCYGLSSLTFAPSSRLATIGQYAFGFCTGLVQTTLPANITDIEHRAFYSCMNLSEISINSVVPPELSVYVFFSCPALQAIKVPGSSIEDYKSAAGWSYYSDMIIPQ
ncbi:MAG: leucine-rich repeat protein [Spirochaetes bacterium]|nr:leucine-rich repeat protein [Spirochaetota bacterium]HOD13343.1 leucine-rich repeat protein [Spirochaetota bacterium]